MAPRNQSIFASKWFSQSSNHAAKKFMVWRGCRRGPNDFFSENIFLEVTIPQVRSLALTSFGTNGEEQIFSFSRPEKVLVAVRNQFIRRCICSRGGLMGFPKGVTWPFGSRKWKKTGWSQLDITYYWSRIWAGSGQPALAVGCRGFTGKPPAKKTKIIIK